ncbi:MAG: hypothetical protein MK078_15775 [Crocinitomicaceae bacterium]|nr:hypothetical protein [Crocinitomicaceae bacterium]
MKKNIFSILAIAAVAFTSCKDETPASSELGEATINGTVWADLDLTNTTTEGIEGMVVSAIIDTRNWSQDPDPFYNYEERVYSATVDANGAYSLTIPATEAGYNVTLRFSDVLTTRTLADGETQNVRVTEGTANVFIYAGAVISVDDEASISVLGSNEADTYGSATIYGNVTGYTDAGFTPEGTEENITGGGYNIVWRYYSGYAPYSSSDDMVYEVAVNADGSYSFTFPTEEVGGNDVYLDFGVLDFEGSQIQLNAAGDGDTTVNGIWTTDWSGSGYGINYYNAEGPFGDGDIRTGYDIEMNFTAF